jgi:CubicO group peptidase (beta-lactamase class C family)
MRVVFKKWIGSILIIALSTVISSCLKDEPFKLPYSGFKPADIGDEWEISSPSAENMDSIKLDQAFRYIYREDEYYLVRSMIIVRNGKIVAEAYPHDPGDIDRIQNVKSDTKSFTGILACIALQNGFLDSVNQKLSNIYPEYFINHQDKTDITIDNALTMRTGCSGENKDSGYERFFTDNSIEYSLSSPWLNTRGVSFYYTDGSPQLISYAIQRKYGKPMADFAEKYLFEPLGIDDWFWQSAKDGITFGASNLNLKPRDMAKFGQMLLQHGRWQNKQIVDSAWVHEATRPHYQAAGWAYGYYFWIYPGENVYWAAGHGGQTIMVAPDKNMVVVVTAWPYVQDNEKWKDNFEFYLYKQVLASCN